ncbi:unnamed protein product [Durusdinium trenchii]|uniref:Core Histone H2A/H2B/H3 domain-containing protein n=1 Tax=Durusdinium trenchii TaxID=1381693 RepID=A0ABP0P2A5_9DINO
MTPLRRLADSFDAFLASQVLIPQIPRLLGPGLNKAGKFPTLVQHSDNLETKVTEVRSQVKFQLKKVLCMGVAVGNVQMTPDELRQNCLMAINFLVSLLKKNWNNVIKELLGKGSVVESLDLKEAPDILAQVLSDEELGRFTTKLVDVSDTAKAQGCAGSWVKKLCYHSSSNAPLGVAVNLLGTINVFEAVKALAEQEVPSATEAFSSSLSSVLACASESDGKILALTDDMPRAQRQWQFHVEQTFSFRDLSIEKDELASVRDWLRKGARGLKLLTADLSTPQATGVASARLYARFNRRTGCVRGGGKQFHVDGSVNEPLKAVRVKCCAGEEREARNRKGGAGRVTVAELKRVLDCADALLESGCKPTPSAVAMEVGDWCASYPCRSEAQATDAGQVNANHKKLSCGLINALMPLIIDFHGPCGTLNLTWKKSATCEEEEDEDVGAIAQKPQKQLRKKVAIKKSTCFQENESQGHSRPTGAGYRVEAEAALARQTATEDIMEQVFRDSVCLARHARRSTLVSMRANFGDPLLRLEPGNWLKTGGLEKLSQSPTLPLVLFLGLLPIMLQAHLFLLKETTTGLRPLTIFGVGREIGLTSGPTKAVKAAILGRRFEIEVSGTTGFHHVADVARLFVETLGGAVRQPGAHVCGIKGHVVSYEEFLKEAAKIVPEVAKLAWIKPQAPEVPIHGDVDEAPLHMLTQRETIHMTLKEAIAEMVRRYQDLKARGKLRDQDLGQEPPVAKL